MSYEKKYLKYKKKYIDLKEQIDFNKKNYNNIEQLGSGWFDLESYFPIPSCKDYYANSNEYKLNNFNNIKELLIKLSGKNNNWDNLSNNKSNYQNTILDELIKIDFDVNKRFDELPELVKLLLHIKPKPAHLLQMILYKPTCDHIINVLNNNVDFKITSLDYSNPKFLYWILSKVIYKGIDPNVIYAVREILDLLTDDEKEKSKKTNTWDSLTKLAEFVGCLSDSMFLDENLEWINSMPEIFPKDKIKKYIFPYISSYKNYLRTLFDTLIVQITLLEDILLFTKERRNLKNLYKNTKGESILATNGNFTINYQDFVLKDFFDTTKNTSFFLPPSVILLLSIKLNPIINTKDYYINVKLRGLLDYLRYQCFIDVTVSNSSDENNITKALENYNSEDKKTVLDNEIEDSKLIDKALEPISNGTFVNTTKQVVLPNDSKPTIVDDTNLEDKMSFFEKIGSGYKNFYNQIKNSLTPSKPINISSILSLKSFNLFNTDPIKRKEHLENKIKKLKKENEELSKEPKKGFLNDIVKFITTSPENKIKNNLEIIKKAEQELKVINAPNNHNEKVGFILANILSLSGIGLNELSNDICKPEKSEIKFSTFDKLLKILDSNLFKAVRFANSKLLMDTLFQYITPYTTYLPFDFKTYFYTKLKITTQADKDKFNSTYQQYEILIFANFVHEFQFYYLENNEANIWALFPPAELLNSITTQVHSTQ